MIEFSKFKEIKKEEFTLYALGKKEGTQGIQQVLQRFNSTTQWVITLVLQEEVRIDCLSLLTEAEPQNENQSHQKTHRHCPCESSTSWIIQVSY